MHTRLRAVLLIVVLLLAAACGDDPAPGEEGWSTSGIRAASSPVGLGNTVAVVDGRSSDLEMVVIDGGTGEIRFTRPWSPSARYSGTGVGTPVLFDNVVVGLEPDGFQSVFVGSDPASGNEIWQVQVEETFGPFVCGELVCSEDNWSLESAALVARDPASGETVWTSPGSQFRLYAQDGLVVVQDLNVPVLRSVDPATGGDRWATDLRETLGPDARPVVAEAVLAGGTLIVESNSNPEAPNGTVGLDPDTGSVRWHHPDFGLCPQPVPDVVVVCSAEAGLQRLDPASGDPLWSTGQFRPPTEPGPFIGVTADLSRILGTTAEGAQVSINLDNGEVGEPQEGLSYVRLSSSEQAKRSPEAPARQYLGPLDPVPWDFPAGRPAMVQNAAELPDFIGMTLGDMRIFLDAGGNLRALPANRP